MEKNETIAATTPGQNGLDYLDSKYINPFIFNQQVSSYDSSFKNSTTHIPPSSFSVPNDVCPHTYEISQTSYQISRTFSISFKILIYVLFVLCTFDLELCSTRAFD